MSGPAAGFNPLRYCFLRRAEAHHLARHDVLPALKGGVSRTCLILMASVAGFDAERPAGLEPATCCLEGSHSTT